MLDQLFHLPENDEKQLPIGEWFYELIWCPSQCYYHIQHNGSDYIFYLRWRWDNPWHGYVVKNAAALADIHNEKAIWSEDVFAFHHVQYSDEEIELAKEKIISLLREFNGEFPERKRPRQKT
jgi:hypothetical protein